MKLYTYYRSSAAYRVRIALNLKGLAYESLPRHLSRGGGEQRKPEFLALNPQGLVPVLEDDGSTLTQSLAIIEYLEETHPEPPLLPRTPLLRARVRALALAIACDIHPLNNLRVLNYLRAPLGLDAAAVDAWYRHWIACGFVALEEEAARCDGRSPASDRRRRLARRCMSCPADVQRAALRLRPGAVSHIARDQRAS